MRLKDTIQKKDFKILVVDDEQGIIGPIKSNRISKKWTFWYANYRLLNDANTRRPSCRRN